VPKPDVKGRLGILSVHSKKSPLSDDVDFAKIAQGTPGFSGADLENLVNEAALIAARQDSTEVHMDHFELAKDKVLMGPERKSMIMSEDEKRNTSYHEAGHALVGLKLKSGDPVHKVSIIPRGQALGVTITLPEEDRYTITREFAEGMIAYAMGGRAAEELMFNQRTTGASDDINKATDIARKMVCQWGMSDVIGPLSLDDKNGQEVFLGRDFKQGSHLSEEVTSQVDKEVSRLVTEGYRKSLQVLKDNKDTLIRMAEALLIKETLGAKELEAIMLGEDIVTAEEKTAYEERIRTKPQNIYELLGDKFADKPEETQAPASTQAPAPETDSV
jgi:cell division protease FtsH